MTWDRTAGRFEGTVEIFKVLLAWVVCADSERVEVGSCSDRVTSAELLVVAEPTAFSVEGRVSMEVGSAEVCTSGAKVAGRTADAAVF